MVFENCEFADNKAVRHGGALALQTVGVVTITGCSFKNNIANFDHEAQLLEFENHYSKKTKGRGGAIYINPTFSNEDSDPALYMKSIKIEGNIFESNIAYDAFGIYIEGDEHGKTEFIIQNNYFLNNYNADTLTITSSVIASEILNVYNSHETITNKFTYRNLNMQIKDFVYVDHYGNAHTYDFIFASNFVKISGEWINSGSYSIINNGDIESIVQFSFLGISFDLYGSYNNEYGTFTINFDGKDIEIINEKQDSQEDVLLFSSPEFEFTTHTLIIKTQSKIEITKIKINIYYQSKISEINTFLGSNDWLIENNNQGGYVHYTEDNDKPLEKTIKCRQFYLFGRKGQNYGKLKIYVDNYLVSNIGTLQDKYENITLLFISDPLENYEHKIKIVPETAPIYIDYMAYTSSLIYDNASYSSLLFEGNWIEGNTGYCTTDRDSILEFNYFGSHFKIYGSKGPNHASLKIVLDEDEIDTISTNNDKEINHFLLYSSENHKIEHTNHTIQISMINEDSIHTKIEICSIFYLGTEIPPTNCFSMSNEFTESIQFTISYAFSNSYSFTKSVQFTSSNFFSESNDFTKSDDFAETLHFSASNFFSETDDFTKSVQFTTSNFFSDTDDFTKSVQFTSSNFFSESIDFTKSDDFGETLHFSASSFFSETDDFTKSIQFTSSNFFSESNDFTKSDDFAETLQFSISNFFSETDNFTKSVQFTSSNYFSKSSLFSASNNLSKSDIYLEDILLKSSDIIFSPSNLFSSSNFFIPSDKFTTSKVFSISDKFTSSTVFNQSDNFSSSAIFSLSDKFTFSDSFKQIIESRSRKITYLLSLSVSFVYKKSVSLTVSYENSNTFLITYLNDLDEYTYVITNTYYRYYIPYVIQYLSPVYIETYLLYFPEEKNTISQEKLIGIVCGSVSVFFIVLGLIICIIRKKNGLYIESDDFYDLSSSTDVGYVNAKNDADYENTKNDVVDYSNWDI